MGDLSTEPSMEEILSSIKRIIAEEGEATPARPRRAPRPLASPPAPEPESFDDEVLELSDPMPPAEEPATMPRAAADPVPPRPSTLAPAAEPIVSSHTAQAARGALDQLSRLMVKPEPPADGTLEGLVREMLRPVLREWLDANLPAMVEDMVQREIAKITGNR